MIDFNFEYYKPNSIAEAVNIYEELSVKGKWPLYYSGGTEIITFARKNDLYTNAVIDIKGIPECRVMELKDGIFNVGGAVTLTDIEESKLIPLFSKVVSFPADHTVRNKITLGGNICGRIIYREAVLAALVTDSIAVIAGIDGIREVPINQVFNQKLLLGQGEFLTKIKVSGVYSQLSYVAIRKVKKEKVSYPLLTVVALKINNQIRIAFSGLCGFPFRSIKVEAALNNTKFNEEQRIAEVINNLPGPILNNIQGSAEYRKFVLKNTLKEVIAILEEEQEGNDFL
jgi:CO/xanthine dehydrogenase FAD-binding subunit